MTKRVQDNKLELWPIMNLKINEFSLFLIGDPKYRKDIYLDLRYKIIESLIVNIPNITLSQYMDSWQNTYICRNDVVLVSDKFNLEYCFTSSYSSDSISKDKSRIYVLNVNGKPNNQWLQRVLFFGGHDLSFILYGLDKKDENWLDTTIHMNKIFIDWFYLKTNNSMLAVLKRKVKFICWTDDTEIGVIVDNDFTIKFINCLGAIAANNNLRIQLSVP